MKSARATSHADALPKIVSGSRLGLLTLLVMVGFVQTGTLLGTAWTTQRVLDPVLTDGASIAVTGIGVLIALAVVGVTCRWLERTAAERLGNHYVHRVRLALYDAITRFQPNRRSDTGVNMVRFTGDLTAVRQWVAMGIARSISASFFLLGVVLALWLLYAPIGQYAVSILAAAVASIFLLGIGVEASVRRARRRRGRLANLIADTLQQVKEITAFGRVRRERQRLARRSTELNEALQSRARWLGALTALTDWVHRMFMIIVIFCGAGALQSGAISVATLLTLCSVAALLGGPLRDLGRVYEYRKNYSIARNKLRTVLTRKPPQQRFKSLPTGPGNLTLRQVALTRGGAVNDLTVQAGDRIALLGGNGSGKSTLLGALAGLETPAQGRVLLDGIETRALRPNDRRDAIGMASHRGGLATGSISKNVRYRIPSAKESTVQAAIRYAGLEDWVGLQPNGLSTRLIGPAGGVSEGEAARIKLARAILALPRLLLLDEIEAGLDSEGRRALNALFNVYPGTIVYATHDPALANLADQQWRLHHGVIHTSPRRVTDNVGEETR